MSENKKSKFSRRKFITLSSMSLATLALDACKKNLPTKLNNQPCYTSALISKKIIIIGSGFGGSIAAKRLTEAGHEVTLLERGKEWIPDGQTKVFSDAFGTNNKAAWLSTQSPLPFGFPTTYAKKYVGVIERINTSSITVCAAACLGGGSVIYGGIWAKPDPTIFANLFPSSINYSELETTYFPKVLQEMKCTEIPNDLYNNPIFKHNEIFKEHNTASNITSVKLKNNFDWNIIQEEINGTKIKSATIGECLFGVNSGAKITTNDTYLKDAKQTGKLEIKTLTIVKEISLNCDNNYIVNVDEIDEDGNVQRNINYQTEYLFLAAGSMATSSLLTKAKAKNTIPNLNEFVGQGFGNNGNALFLRDSINVSTGTQQSFPPIYAATDFANTNMPLYIEHFPFNFGSFDARALGYNFMGLNTARGYFKYNATTQNVDLIYPNKSATNQNNINIAAKNKLNQINTESSGSISSLLGSIPVDNFTYHPLGGVVIGKATDDFGRIKNHNKLYAIDSSLIPGATVCNPGLTVCAIVERCLENIISKDF